MTDDIAAIAASNTMTQILHVARTLKKKKKSVLGNETRK